MKKILFVCRSNFCRSPLAQGLFEHFVKEKGMTSDFEVDSAGTHDYQLGFAPDKNTQAIALKYGFDISHQRARQVVRSDFSYFDHILVMDNQNKITLSFLCPTPLQHKIKLLMPYAKIDPIEEVPDPYQQGIEGFETVYAYLSAATRGFLENIT